MGEGRVVGNVDGIEVERLEKLPFLFGRHQRVGHEGIECLKTLDVNLDRCLVALLRSVKGVLFGIAYTSQVAHARFRLDVIHIFAISFLTRG